jgi:putative membrane protein
MITQFKKFKFPRIVANFQNRERIILRDFLALERTSLANERTLFSYIRISIYLVIGGIAFLKIEDLKPISWTGYISFGLSVFLLVYGVIRYRILRNRLQQFYRSIDFHKEQQEEQQEQE